MGILLLILLIVILLSLGGGAAILFVFRQRPMADTVRPTGQAVEVSALAFRWYYTVAPLVVFILSVSLVAFFYQKLPDEVAYHFRSDGTPDGWLSRGTIILWTILPQFLLALLAAATTWGATRLGAQFKATATTRRGVERIMLLMGNMIALPQLILCFAMLDIFSYNSYQMHVMPIWVFALIVMGLGTIVLGVFFVWAIRQVWGTSQ